MRHAIISETNEESRLYPLTNPQAPADTKYYIVFTEYFIFYLTANQIRTYRVERLMSVNSMWFPD